MSELFRKVLTEDRRPNKDGYYDTNIGELFYVPGINNWVYDHRIGEQFPSWWLEPITLPTDEDAVNWIIQNVLRGLSPEKQKEVTKFLLSRGMYNEPTDEEIEKMAADKNISLSDRTPFEIGFKSALKYMEGKS